MRKNKFISLFLVAVMVLSCCVIAGVTSSAASGDEIYFDNSVTKFDTVYCYAFNDGSDDVSEEAMTNESGEIWKYSLNGDWDYIMFGDGEIKSAELSCPGDNKIAKPDSVGEGFTVSWSDYTVEETTEAVTAKPEETTKPETKAVEKKTVEKKAKLLTSAGTTIYCQNELGWSKVNCYMWNGSGGSGNENSGWPGKPMTSIGDNVWEYTPDKSYENVIFNDGNSQTGNLSAPAGKNMCNNKTEQWDVYSSSPVKITSFTTDIESPSYTNSAVSIAAVAKSAQGTLSYKFSVKNSSGAVTVLSDSSSSSTIWVPTAAGKYTLTVDVKDSAGNTNSRSIKDFEIKDASALVEPFISSFTNSLGTSKTIKLNTSVTFTTGALGGKTGTNLLFYKFIITDPDGNDNIPYYTLNQSYTYTPNKLGTYTVKAYVQNSANDTISRTYTYECKGDISGDETQPATQQPGTQPATQQPGTQPATQQPGTQPATQQPDTQPGTQGTTAPVVTVPDAKLGDVNMDGYVNVKDATLIQKHVAKLVTLDSKQAKLADTNKDGYVSVKDATQIQKLVAKLISSF